ncbi:MAG: glycosyltransferase family 2 protein, partial [SAR324 cluster bacterium]|nr:glycosyltransferase family 2 protein [SAR324 cluster bacterium]
MNPQISVVIPAYNSKELLQRCLKSLASQTASLSRFEVIVVDDGSSDGTMDMLHSFAQNSPFKFNFRHIPNSGPATARNLGISLATCDWIAFLDADVVAHPNWIQRGLELIEQNPFAGG